MVSREHAFELVYVVYVVVSVGGGARCRGGGFGRFGAKIRRDMRSGGRDYCHEQVIRAARSRVRGAWWQGCFVCYATA